MKYDQLWTAKNPSVKGHAAVVTMTYEQLMEIGNLLSNIHEAMARPPFLRLFGYPLQSKIRLHGEILAKCRDVLTLLEASDHDVS